MKSRSYRSYFSAMAAAFASVALFLPAPASLQTSRGAPKKRNKTGAAYPFSSTRQNARYARQLAAGQLMMDGVPARGKRT